MILSVSRRTDIPAFYMPWFMNRLREGYVMVRNPMNYHQVSRVSLSPEVIDCMVFWTKNAIPLTPHLGEIALQYPFYIQYTLNPYGRDLEPGLPPLAQRLASACAIAEQFGSKHVVWRYDPIMLTEQYTADWHIEQFAAMADALKGSARDCVFSFVDLYDKVQANLRGLGVRICSDGEMDRIAAAHLCGEGGSAAVWHRPRLLRGRGFDRGTDRLDDGSEEGPEPAPGMRLPGEH